jgi:hypothetical protein
MSLHAGADQNADQLLNNTMKLNGGIISVGCLLDNGYTRGITKAQLRIAVKNAGLKHDEVDGRKYLYADEEVWKVHKAWAEDVASWRAAREKKDSEFDDPIPFDDPLPNHG